MGESRNPMTRAVLIGVVFAAGMLVLIVLAVRSSFKHTCEVCVAFDGRTECRSASGRTPEEATRTAIDNACAFVASGMTDTVACTTGTAPTSVSCNEASQP
jgi:hypothetical protein